MEGKMKRKSFKKAALENIYDEEDLDLPNEIDKEDEKVNAQTSKNIKTMKDKPIKDKCEESIPGLKKEGNQYSLELNKKKKLTIRQFKDMILIDLREFFEKDGQELPSKKGISLTEECWKTLKENFDNIDKAISEMKLKK